MFKYGYLKCIRGGGDHQDLCLLVCYIAPAMADIIGIIQCIVFIQFVGPFIFHIKYHTSIQNIHELFAAVVGVIPIARITDK